jgi:hypothetical protein
MIDTNKIIELIKLKQQGVLIRNVETGEFIEPQPGESGNFEFVDASTIDELILQEAIGEKVGQNDLLVMYVLKNLLEKKLSPVQVSNVKKKMAEGKVGTRRRRRTKAEMEQAKQQQ